MDTRVLYAVSGPRLEVYATPADLEAAAAARILDSIRTAIRARGVSLLALSGGETPRGVYRRLGMVAEQEHQDWSQVHLVFGDERMVPPDDPQSNFGMVRQELKGIPAMNIHRIRGESAPEKAAREYAAELQILFSTATDRFDLVLLGLGEDGHTASLFPGSEALLEERERAVHVPGPGSWRVTLTLPVINNAREVVFLVSGERKASILSRVLSAPLPDPGLPATLVRPESGVVVWMIDGDAASLLNSPG